MNITSLSLRNFKCFQKLDLDFGKLTILTGANSSGKSSIINSLLGALQTKKFPFYYSPNEHYVNMGDFADIAYGHKKDLEIKIDLTMQLDAEQTKIQSAWKLGGPGGMPALKSLRFEEGGFLLNLTNGKEYVWEFKIPSLTTKATLPDWLLRLLMLYATDRVMLQTDKNTQSTEGNGQQFLKEVKALLSSISNKKFKIKQIDEILTDAFAEKHRFSHEIFNTLSEKFSQSNDAFNYVSPFRLQPERTYLRKSQDIRKVDRFGVNYIDQILDWESRKSKKLKELIQIMKTQGLLTSIKSRKLSGGRFEILVKLHEKGRVWAPLSDVGFGISQFLPVIVADLQLDDSSTLALAQPEIHLHPSVQAQFADYLNTQIKKEKRYIVETHSEYFLNRIRLLIAQEKLNPADISIYYLENSPKGTQTHRIQFTPDGQISGAPKGFFETYLVDSMDIAINAKIPG